VPETARAFGQQGFCNVLVKVVDPLLRHQHQRAGVSEMNELDWATTPVGIDAGRWLTRQGCRVLLIVVHTMASCHRLLDVVDLVEADARLQMVFTVAPDSFNTGVTAYLQRLGALVIPWQQAVRERFDLALAASHGGLHQLHSPVLVMAHGAGRARVIQAGSPLPSTMAAWSATGESAPAEPVVYGLDAPRLIRDGRVVAAAIVLSHENELSVLARQCPSALPLAVVVGDPCFDRLLGSRSARQRYRHAMGLGDHQQLVVVSSTWGEDGLFGGVPALLPALMDQLPPDRFRVAALLHPAITAAHGQRQIKAWTRDCREAGMVLIDPADDWRAYLVAADRLVGDHGSVTAYGAAIGLPVLCVPTSNVERTAGGTAQEIVLNTADRLDVTKPLRRQLVSSRPVDRRLVSAAITSRPYRAGRLLRRTIYRLIGLAELDRVHDVLPVVTLGGLSTTTMTAA
jgi:hypothetical protein